MNKRVTRRGKAAHILQCLRRDHNFRFNIPLLGVYPHFIVSNVGAFMSTKRMYVSLKAASPRQ